jgi:nicotinamidase-related amidase
MKTSITNVLRRFLIKKTKQPRVFKEKKLPSMAVVLVDMQTDFVEDADPKKLRALIEAQKLILEECLVQNIPVFVLELARRGETITELAKILQKIPRVTTIIKGYDDGFWNTDLDLKLKELGIEHLVLMGINASHCVLETAQSAIELGYTISTGKALIANYCDCGENGYEDWYIANGKFFKGDLVGRELLA